MRKKTTSFEKSQTIDVGTKGEIKFENLPLVQKNEDSSTSPLVYVVAETKVEFEVGGKTTRRSLSRNSRLRMVA